jgi:uncharacterized protein with PhoU and TrkA domain
MTLTHRKRRTKAFEEVEYEPLNVLEILTEMKDLSELMVSLAYGALVLENDPIADEVEDMARRMDWLKYQLRIMSSLGVRTKEEAEQVAGVLQIGDASEHVANAAADLVEILDANLDMQPFLGGVLEETDDRIGTQKVPEGSRAIGQTLGAMNLEAETGVRVVAVRRGSRWIYRPGKAHVNKVDDMLLVRGQLEGAEHFRDWLNGKEDEL